MFSVQLLPHLEDILEVHGDGDVVELWPVLQRGGLPPGGGGGDT